MCGWINQITRVTFSCENLTYVISWKMYEQESIYLQMEPKKDRLGALHPRVRLSKQPHKFQKMTEIPLDYKLPHRP